VPKSSTVAGSAVFADGCLTRLPPDMRSAPEMDISVAVAIHADKFDCELVFI
jgi:hypothetical protein